MRLGSTDGCAKLVSGMFQRNKFMTEYDQLTALAELDGYGQFSHDFRTPPDYLHSYDAIIPLIQKQSQEIQDRLGDIMCRMDAFKYRWFWQSTTSQLCEALLRATGKWKEDPALPPHKHSYREDSTVCEICGA